MSKAQGIAIPKNSLPKDWRAKGAEKFGVSTSMIEKIVSGKSINEEVTAYMLGLAEDLKKEREQLQQRVAELAQ